MSVIDSILGRGLATDGLPRAHWKPVRGMAVFAGVALVAIMTFGLATGASIGDVAAIGVIGSAVGFFLLRTFAEAPRRTVFTYANGRPAYQNSRASDSAYADYESDPGHRIIKEWDRESAEAAAGLEPYASRYGFNRDFGFEHWDY